MKSSIKIVLLLYPILLFGAQPKPGQPTAGKTRLDWFQAHRQMADKNTLTSMKHKFIFKNLKWKFIGPQWMSGRITDIDAPADNPYTLYAASASGGLWKTTNEGTTWIPILDDQPSATLGDIAVSQSNPQIVWAGTGENNSSRSTYSGVGVFKSGDGGKTWKHMGLEDSHHIGAIVIHPENPDIVYVASMGSLFTYNRQRGVYKTTDGGNTWEECLYIDDRTGFIEMVMDPADPNILYAAAWERLRKSWEIYEYGPGTGIYITRDGGKTWSKGSGIPSKGLEGRIGLAVSQSDPDVVYASLDNHDTYRTAAEGERDPYGLPARTIIHGIEVYRSDDRGSTWKKANKEHMGSVYNTYGYYFGEIRVHPKDAKTVWILGVPCMKSTDGGQTFASIPDEGMHGDYQAMWIDPRNPERIVMGNDGGLNISYDCGQTWKDIQNLPVVQFYHVAVDNAKPFNVYATAQDHGCFMGPSDHNPDAGNPYDWKYIPGGEASYLAVDPTDPNILYNEGYYGSLERSNLSTNESKSIKPSAPEGISLRSTWLTPFILSPHNPFILYYGSQFLHRSVDRGDHWQTISPDLTDNDPKRQGDVPFGCITTISESVLVPGLIWAGTDDGNVHVTQNCGNSWSKIKGLEDIWVSRVEASRFKPDVVYVALNGYREDNFGVYLYRVSDYGKTVQPIGSNIPGGPVNVLKQDPDCESILYAGTDTGVYVTFDEGKNWNLLGKGLPTTFVHDLVVHPDRVLVAATHGRGIYVMDVSGLKDFVK